MRRTYVSQTYVHLCALSRKPPCAIEESLYYILYYIEASLYYVCITFWHHREAQRAFIEQEVVGAHRKTRRLDEKHLAYSSQRGIRSNM